MSFFDCSSVMTTWFCAASTDLTAPPMVRKPPEITSSAIKLAPSALRSPLACNPSPASISERELNFASLNLTELLAYLLNFASGLAETTTVVEFINPLISTLICPVVGSTDATRPLIPEAHRAASADCRCAMSDFVIRYTERAGSVFLSSDMIPLTMSLSPVPISPKVDATAAFSDGLSGGTLLYSVFSERITSSVPSFVCNTIFAVATDTTSPVATVGFTAAVCEKELLDAPIAINSRNRVRIKLLVFINHLLTIYL